MIRTRGCRKGATVGGVFFSEAVFVGVYIHIFFFFAVFLGNFDFFFAGCGAMLLSLSSLSSLSSIVSMRVLVILLVLV